MEPFRDFSHISLRFYSAFFLDHIELLLLDPGLLTGEVPEVEDSCPAYLADLVQLDAVNERRLERENPFYTYTA